MNKTFYTLIIATGLGLFAAGAARAQSQVANASFDTWVSRFGYEAPDNWLTSDDFWRTVQRSAAQGTVVKTTVARSGPFALELQTKERPGGGTNTEGAVFVGTSFSPNLLSGQEPPSAVRFSSRPTGFQFYYQLSGPQAVADEPTAVVLLTRKVNGNLVTVGAGFFNFRATASTYTRAYAPIFYTSTLTPESVSIQFNSGDAQNTTVGTTLRIDDLTFIGGTTATRNAANAADVTFSPNPSPNGRFTIGATQPELLAAPLAVLDGLGRMVHREAAPAGTTVARVLDLSHLPAGLYTVQLFTAQGLITRRLAR